MIEVIKTIALLCSVQGGNNSVINYDEQFKCQQYYANCVKASDEFLPEKKLLTCMVKRDYK